MLITYLSLLEILENCKFFILIEEVPLVLAPSRWIAQKRKSFAHNPADFAHNPADFAQHPRVIAHRTDDFAPSQWDRAEKEEFRAQPR
jgi:hypothetical protein